MKLAGNRPVSSLNELKTCENGLGGQNCLDFGTVRPGFKSRAPTIFELECTIATVVMGQRRCHPVVVV